MKKLKKFGQLNEADIHDTLPDDYLRDVENKGRQQYGNRGPSMQEMQEGMGIMQQIQRIQRGHYDELTQIGIDILKRNYPILNDVELDVKIVNPDDEEKMEMTQKMIGEMETPDSVQDMSGEDEDDVDEDEVSKRKIINNLMQGESQNVHTMMYESKPLVDAINPRLMDLYMRGLEINKKFDWMDRADLERMVNDMPQMANVMETDYEEDEEGNSKPKIKARVLDLPMVIHEVVKGIYELIAANAIPEDSVTAMKVLKKTDTLRDEQSDIRFGPFIAADMRNYLNEHFEKEMSKYQLNNIKELIYGKMMLLPTKQFIDTVKGMLLNKEDDTLNTLKKILKEVVNELDQYSNKLSYQDVEDYELDDDDNNDLIDYMKGSNKPKSVKNEPNELTDKDLVNMSQGELNNLIDKCLDDGNFELMKRVQKFIKTK